MARVQGVGGVFFRARDAAALAAWYGARFGLSWQHWGDSYGLIWPSQDLEPAGRQSITVFTIFQADERHPSTPGGFRINLHVDGLDELCAALQAAGTAVERVADESFGRFARLTDPEGHELELWEPPLEG
jgi:predicted enzyme related to lactoylglutathione lyase